MVDLINLYDGGSCSIPRRQPSRMHTQPKPSWMHVRARAVSLPGLRACAALWKPAWFARYCLSKSHSPVVFSPSPCKSLLRLCIMRSKYLHLRQKLTPFILLSIGWRPTTFANEMSVFFCCQLTFFLIKRLRRQLF